MTSLKASRRVFKSEGDILKSSGSADNEVLKSKSESYLSTRKSHPLLNFDDDFSKSHYGDIILAAETLENIVNEGSFIGYRAVAKSAGCREMSNNVLKLVYGTMKFLSHVDTLLVKTEFLVFNNQFLNHLAMVKVLIYDTMKHHFNFSEYPGIDYSTPKDLASSETEQQNVEIVKSLEDRLRDFELKLSACYARLRIEVKAAGDSSREQMENTISAKERQKENQAAEMPQTLRINTSTISKVNLFRKLRESGYNAICSTPSQIVKDGGSYDAESCILLDEEFENLVVVPASMYGSLKASHFVGNAWLISQDKASMYGLEHASSLINEGMHVIDARAGCGTKVMYLSELVGISGHVFAFENRPGRIETLKANLKRCDINNVTIVEEDFVNSDIYNPRFAKVTSIIVEPTNSCSAIIDKLGYMLQEEEFPADKPTQKDLYALKRQQVIALKHAFKCKYFNNLVPFVDSVLYITRSTHKEENGQVVEEVLDRYGVDWTLWPVVGNNSQDQSEDFEETFPLPTGSGNGTYLAQFRLKKAIKEKEEEIERHRQSLAEMSVLDLETKIPKRRSSKPAEKFIPQAALKRIPKNIVVTVERLSVPKRYMGEVVPPVKRTIFASSSKKFKSEHSSIAEPRSDDDIIKKLTNMSLFGSNLSKFFSPQAEALEKIKLKHLELSSTQLVL